MLYNIKKKLHVSLEITTFANVILNTIFLP